MGAAYVKLAFYLHYLNNILNNKVQKGFGVFILDYKFKGLIPSTGQEPKCIQLKHLFSNNHLSKPSS